MSTLFTAALSLVGHALWAAQIPIVAAASDLQFALEEVARQFALETGQQVRLSFGSSGNFRRQIAAGAPFEMYLSADEDYVLALAREGHTLDEGTLYALGRIVLVVPPDSALKADAELKDLALAIHDGRLERFAIANPEHAPYGQRAREALEHAGLWHYIQKHLVLGENVSQAAQFATSGNAQGGIIAYSIVLSAKLTQLADYRLIPSHWHQPLRQRMVLLRGAGDTATQFYDYVRSESARTILRRYGFLLPQEASKTTR